MESISLIPCVGGKQGCRYRADIAAGCRQDRDRGSERAFAVAAHIVDCSNAGDIQGIPCIQDGTWNIGNLGCRHVASSIIFC